jgi:hypothetical protein
LGHTGTGHGEAHNVLHLKTISSTGTVHAKLHKKNKEKDYEEFIYLATAD